MSDDSDSDLTYYNLQFLPTEILLNILIRLTVKDLTNCRAVCVRWLGIIDELARNDDLWAKHCKKDFSNVYEIAHEKAMPGLLLFNLYRSLTLWRHIAVSQELIDEFSAASCWEEKINNFEVLRTRVLGVHKKYSIAYYDIDTLQQIEREGIEGHYAKYAENNEAIVLLNFHSHCLLVQKRVDHRTYREKSCATFHNVKLFTLTKTALYFVDIEDEIFVCSLADAKLQHIHLKKSLASVVSIGYSNGELNVLTFQRVIFRIVGTEAIYRCQLGHDSNLLHQLLNYNLLEQLDWRVYYQWMYMLKHFVPDGPLKDIVIIRPYGDVYFVGSIWGVLRIYYAPYSAGEFDIFNKDPVKEYNFMEQSDSSSRCPILQVDVIEVQDGHKILVAMQKKIVVLNITHK